MKIAFKVDRIGFYRLFAPLMDEALRSGHDVVALHRDMSTDRGGLKAYQWADPKAIPSLQFGAPTVVQYRDAGELVGHARGVDALVTIWAWSEAEACAALSGSGVAWVALQESHEFHVFGPEMLLRPDRMCLFSEWWIDLIARYYPDVSCSRWRETLVSSGWPQLDSFGLVDPDHVARRLGAESKPIVTLASYKQHRDDPWEQLVFRSATPLTATLRTLAHGRFDLLPAARRGPRYVSFVRALRAFADRNSATLISKSRGKDEPPSEEIRLVDRAIGDGGYYPATVVELARASEVIVSFLSTVTLEAVYGGAMSLCPIPPPESAWLRDPRSLRFRQLLGYREPGSLWNFPGVVLQRSVDEFIEDLPVTDLRSLRTDPRARAAYVETFLGGETRHATRTLEAILDTVERKRSTKA